MEDVIEHEPDWVPLKVKEMFVPYFVMGLYCNFAVLILLGELLVSHVTETYKIEKYSLVFCGLVACMWMTCLNLLFFCITSVTNDFEWRLNESGKWKAYAVLGYGAITSVLFFMGCLVKYFGSILGNL